MPPKAKWDGLGDRLRLAIKLRGFVDRKGEADIQRFALEHRYLPNYVYRWVNDTTTPDRDNILKLARDLGVSPAWLLFGDEGENRQAIAGGSDTPQPPQVDGEPVKKIIMSRFERLLYHRWPPLPSRWPFPRAA